MSDDDQDRVAFEAIDAALGSGDPTLIEKAQHLQQAMLDVDEAEAAATSPAPAADDPPEVIGARWMTSIEVVIRDDVTPVIIHMGEEGLDPEPALRVFASSLRILAEDIHPDTSAVEP